MNASVQTEPAPRRAVRAETNRVVSALSSLALVLSVCVGIAVASVVAATSAAAVPGPTTEPAATDVTADALPTVQIDGVVWSQAVVGNNVYAGGTFKNARPAGAAPGTNLTPRANLLSYNITTGVLNTSFAPSLNGTVKAVAASPDGSRIYVGGSFTQADGQARYRLAAYSTATGQLISSFQPILDYDVNAIVATNTTVYVGGGFSSANNVARARLAAFSASDGSLLAWAPTADNHDVEAMVLAPGGGKIIVGGSFTTLNGSSAGYGLGALDATTGALLSWPATNVIRDAGDNGAILSLSTDGTSVYATGYNFGAGANFEGTTSMNPSTGAINWVEDCHGDTYGAFPMNGAVYTISHAHYCGNVGGFPQPAVWQYHHALAFSTQTTGTLLTDSVGYASFGGQPSPSLLNWFPDMDSGTFTGQDQAAWNVTGNTKYLVLGGEFPTVNGTPQQGLVRFGVPSVSTNQQAPMDSGSNFMPTLRAVSATSVRVSWPANWDRDDQQLTYHLARNGDVNHPIYTATATSQFWNRPRMGYVDKGLTPGTSYDYRLNVTDSDGHVVWGDTASITTPTTTPSAYAQQIPADNAASYWRLDQTSGTTLADSSGADNLTAGSGVSGGAPGAIGSDSDTASNFNGSSSGTAYTSTATPAPNTYSLEAWFKTTTHSGGKIVGFGNSQGSSSVVDRQIYMDNSGHLVYGVWQNSNNVVTSTGTYNDGTWHQVVATLSGAGMVLFVDGQQVAANNAVTIGRPYYGYWRVGGDSLAGWPSAPTSGYFSGTLDDVAVYPTALPLATVQNHYSLSGRTVPGGTNKAPTAAFTPSCTALACSFNGSGSSDSDGSVASYAWTFGDGASGTGVSPSHSYAAGGSYTVTLTVTDDKGATNAVSHVVTVAAANKAPTAAFTSSCTALACGFNGSGSTDSDGTVASYAWTFGDGASGTGASPSHTYAKAGSYTVTLTVTDNKGATNAVSHVVTVAAANKAPTAAFTSSCTALACGFNGSGSTDSDGTVASYAWTFGDGSSGTGVSPSHTYAKGGSYTVTLTVTDDKTATNSVSHAVTVTAANQAPTASFTSSCTALACSFTGSGSTDPDGTVASYAWTFGDGSSGTGVSPSHSYAAGGSYSVTLTVTDDKGATNAVSHTVTVAAATALAASFTTSCADLACSFDASSSTAAPGSSLRSYSWNYGDRHTGSGVRTSHSYRSSGTYTVSLRITDNRGRTATTTKQVTVTAPPRHQIRRAVISDQFGHAVRNGWGTAAKGGKWSAKPNSVFAVRGGRATVRLTKSATKPMASLPKVSRENLDVTFDSGLSKAPAGKGAALVSVMLRKNTNGNYRFKVRYLANGAVHLLVSKTVGSKETIVREVAVKGLHYKSGTMLRARVDITGVNPTTVVGRVWKVGSAAPKTAQIKVVDRQSALQRAGSFAMRAFLAGAAAAAPIVGYVDNLTATS